MTTSHQDVPSTLPPERDFAPLVPPDRQDPTDFYRWARTERPVFFSPSVGAWLITRYDDLMTVVHDPDTYSSRNAVPSIWDNPPEVTEALAGCVRAGTAIVNEDEPRHGPLRKVLNHAFSGHRVRAVQPLMQRRADELLDAVSADRRVELVSQYADPYVQTVVSAVFGIPDDDVEQVCRWTEDSLLITDPSAPLDRKIAAARGLVAYEAYISDLIEDRRRHPREDFISDMVHGAGDDVPAMSREDILYAFRGLRVAGHDTTRDTITTSVLLMLQHREHWERACADPRSIPRLIEESLRRDAPHRGLMRITNRETELGGVRLPEGAPLLLLFGSGNHDETKFPDPETMRPDRDNLRDHLAFGHGIHRCAGATLARTEIRVAIETLTRRLPGLRIEPGYEPTYVASYLFRGLETLPLRW